LKDECWQATSNLDKALKAVVVPECSHEFETYNPRIAEEALKWAQACCGLNQAAAPKIYSAPLFRLAVQILAGLLWLAVIAVYFNRRHLETAPSAPEDLLLGFVYALILFTTACYDHISQSFPSGYFHA